MTRILQIFTNKKLGPLTRYPEWVNNLNRPILRITDPEKQFEEALTMEEKRRIAMKWNKKKIIYKNYKNKLKYS